MILLVVASVDPHLVSGISCTLSRPMVSVVVKNSHLYSGSETIQYRRVSGLEYCGRLLHHSHLPRLSQNQIRVIFYPLFSFPLYRLFQYVLAFWGQLLFEITKVRHTLEPRLYFGLGCHNRDRLSEGSEDLVGVLAGISAPKLTRATFGDTGWT